MKTLDIDARIAKITISGSETVKFGSKYSVFAVKGDNILASLKDIPAEQSDGVYNTADGGGVTLIREGFDTDTLYLSGTGDIIVWAGTASTDCPFNRGGKGGGSGSGGSIFRTTTALTDGATTNPITVNGESVTVKSGDFAVYNTQEFLFDGTQWDLLGDRVGLGDLAYKSSATGTALTNAGTLPSLTYDSVNERLIFNAGTLPTEGTVTVT